MRQIHACQHPNCNKTYVNSSILKRHIQAFHNSEKRFQCRTCGKCLASRQNLKEHSYIHTGEKPYKFQEPGCSAAFRQGTHLSAHKKIEHSQSSNPTFDCSANLSVVHLTQELSTIFSSPSPTPEPSEDFSILKPITQPYICKLPNIFEQ